MRQHYSFLLLATFFCTSPLAAQSPTIDSSRLEEFQNQNPQARFQGSQYFDDEGFFEFVGTANTIYGTKLATGQSPESSAWNFYSQIEGIYAREVGQLVPAKNAEGIVRHGVMWDANTQTHRFSTFRFNQTVGDIPVFRSGIGFLVRNEAEFPLVMSSNNLKEMQGFDAAAGAFVPPRATPAMIANAGRLMDEMPLFAGGNRARSVLDGVRQAEPLPIQVSDEQLVIWAGVTNVPVDQPELAVVFVAERGTVSDPSTYGKHLVVASATNGEVLYSENQVVADVDGTVSGQQSDGPAALECEPEAPFALPYVEVQILGGDTVFADENGDFNIPSGANGNVTVRSPLRGRYFELFDQSAGGSTPFIDINVAAPGSVDILHNPNPTGEFATSNINCYFRSNEVRDFVLDFEPNFPVIANQLAFDVNSNLNDSCNAFYNGSSINMFRNAGSCNSTSIPDVIYHEYGHHLVNVTGNGQGQFGEGSGDTIGVLMEDDPNLALGFFEGSCNDGIRTAQNSLTFPCDGPIHTCGQLLSGVVWDTINELRVSDPDNARDIAARLWIGMLIVRGQMFPGSSTIGPEIGLIFLQLDDDDEFIGNGTPHYEQIANAFNPRNLTVPELEPILLALTDGTPELVNPAGGTSFQVDVLQSASTATPDTGVLYVDSGSGFVQVPMTVVDDDTYSAVFPPTDCGAAVSFYVSVDADSGDTVTLPTNAPATTFSSISATGVTVEFEDTFDANLGWSVTGNASDGQWERGVPNNGDRGDPSEDAEDNGNGFCYVTDNGNFGDNNSDVDNGSTVLTSPVLDATTSGDQQAYIAYYRWYSNVFGNAPMADVFVVDISNDGGATWVNLETVGPSGPEVSGGWIRKQFRISDFVTPTANMRLRFNASDLGDGSVVEAAVDGFQVLFFECEDEVVVGDVNRDGVVNLLDVAPFVDLLSNGEFQAEADINMDGVVNLLDVDGFVQLLGG